MALKATARYVGPLPEFKHGEQSFKKGEDVELTDEATIEYLKNKKSFRVIVGDGTGAYDPLMLAADRSQRAIDPGHSANIGGLPPMGMGTFGAGPTDTISHDEAVKAVKEAGTEPQPSAAAKKAGPPANEPIRHAPESTADAGAQPRTGTPTPTPQAKIAPKPGDKS